MSTPNSDSRSSGGGLKNVHWSLSKSIRTNEPERRERLVATGVEQLDDHVGVAVGLDVGALAARGAGAAGRRPGRSPTG